MLHFYWELWWNVVKIGLDNAYVYNQKFKIHKTCIMFPRVIDM